MPQFLAITVSDIEHDNGGSYTHSEPSACLDFDSMEQALDYWTTQAERQYEGRSPTGLVEIRVVEVKQVERVDLRPLRRSWDAREAVEAAARNQTSAAQERALFERLKAKFEPEPGAASPSGRE